MNRHQKKTDSIVCASAKLDIIDSLPRLLQLLNLEKSKLNNHAATADSFSLRAPHAFIQRISKADPQDPLLRQILPTFQENLKSPLASLDPVNEQKYIPVPGLIHKYAGRALIITTAACPIHCRYCFRRHFPYREHYLNETHWQRIIDYLTSKPSVKEVILSGGDPLSITDAKLAAFISDLEQIQHIKRLRFHSRYPIVLPARINKTFACILKSTRLHTIMVVHCNHAKELDCDVREAINQLRQAGTTVFNQAVLLKGINDNARVLCQLSEKLFSYGILPYYLNLLDPVQGSEHFQVSEKQAKRLFTQIKKHLPGYLVPKLVKDTGNGESKTWLS